MGPGLYAIFMELSGRLANNSTHTHILYIYMVTKNDLYNIGNYCETVRQDNTAVLSDIRLKLSEF
jgi:hypothetical protein